MIINSAIWKRHCIWMLNPIISNKSLADNYLINVRFRGIQYNILINGHCFERLSAISSDVHTTCILSFSHTTFIFSSIVRDLIQVHLFLLSSYGNTISIGDTLLLIKLMQSLMHTYAFDWIVTSACIVCVKKMVFLCISDNLFGLY